MRKLTVCLLTIFLVSIYNATNAQTKTQSVIYDATTLMNAKHGINALLIPTAIDFDIQDPATGKTIDHSMDADEPSFFVNKSALGASVFAILKRNAGLPEDATDPEVINAYSQNPFLKDLVKTDFRTVTITESMKKVSHYNSPRESGAVLQDLLGNLVNGTADFLIKRAQEEISISVFEKLKQFITRYPEFDTLFPKTCALIKPVEAYEYSKALQAFKDAIHEDLENFISRIALLYDIPRYNLLNKRIPSLTFVFSATSLFSDLHDKAGFAECVYNLGQQSFLQEENNYANFLKVIVTLSNSLLDKKLADEESKEPEYIHKEYILLVTHNDPELLKELSRMYLGLIWQHTYTLSFSAGASNQNFGKLLEHWANNPAIGKALQTINISLNAIIKANKDLKDLKKQEQDESLLTGKSGIKAQRFKIYAELVNQLMGLTEIYLDPSSNVFSLRVKQIREYFPDFTSGVIDMIKYFKEEEYSLGISKFADVLKTVSDYLERAEKDKTISESLSTAFENTLNAQKHVLDSVKEDLQHRVNILTKAIATPNNEAEKQELLTAIDDIDATLEQIGYQKKYKKTVIFKLSKVISYVNLLAAITKAENSAAVESLLETYALPAGSSRVKKASCFNFAINAYVGGFFGRSKQEGEGFTNTYGLTAPIGLTFSTGLQRMGSFSLFAGVFDIGGIIKYKLDNQGKYQQDISVAGIVSPSIHVVYGFPFFLPFSAGAGYQWVSPVTTNSNKINLKPGFNAFVAVDIPLFNLVNSSKKRKL